MFSQGQLWFSHQNELNDPYDCKYAFSDKFIDTLLKKSSDTFLKDLKERVPTISDIDEDKYFKCMLPKLKSNGMMNVFYNMLFGDMGWSVCCFTTNPLNEIMWAHYAAGSKGVCLEFDFTKTSEFYEKLFPVRYTNEFPEIDSIENLTDALLRKRTAWEQEEEWRILTNVRGYKAFNRESLTAIYFGCNADSSSIKNVIQAINHEDYSQVELKKVRFIIKGMSYSKIDNEDMLNIKK